MQSADELLAQTAYASTRRGSPELDEAVDWLKTALANGPLPADDVVNEGRARGFAPITIRRARAKLGIEVKKKGFQGPWIWALPAQSSGDSVILPADTPDDF